MKIAIATDNNQVSAHFGRCSRYTIFDVDDQKITAKNIVDTPEHQPGVLPRFLHEKGVELVIAGGMGPKAQTLFDAMNIQQIIGIAGRVDDVILDFISGALQGGESLCSHGKDHHHDCNHH